MFESGGGRRNGVRRGFINRSDVMILAFFWSYEAMKLQVVEPTESL
jgi:hypothetical protein